MLLNVIVAGLVGIAAAAPTVVYSATNSQTTPENLLVFGDSYSDNCNTWRITGNVAKNNKEFPYPACPPAPTGRASGGKSWPEYVASTSPINVVNYAYSAATCSNKLFPRYAQQTNGSALIPAVEDQITIFLENTDMYIAPSNTAVAIFIGTNDLTFFTSKFHPSPANETDHFAIPGTTLPALATCVVAQVERLINLGFNRIVVFEAIPLQYTQLFSANMTQGYGYKIVQDGPFVASTMATLVDSNNDIQKLTLVSKYQHSAEQVSIFPTHGLYLDEYKNPEKYGYKTVDGFCNICPSSLGSSGVCTPCSNPDDFLFFDQLHPSDAAQKVLAKQVIDFLKSPMAL